MSDMKIYVANLRAYNEGHLKGDWFDLPVEMSEVFEKVFEPHELDENGQPQTDWAIHDYELPFQVSEYESIDKLNIVRLPDDHAESVVSQLMDELQNDFGEVKQRSFKKERNNNFER